MKRIMFVAALTAVFCASPAMAAELSARVDNDTGEVCGRIAITRTT